MTVARQASVERKVVEQYFTIIEDLLLAVRLPVFTKKAKRETISHPKFFFFDVGVFRTLRPKGPLDSPEEIDGPALETLLFEELRAINDYLELDYRFYYWRTRSQLEVDLVAYGERGICAFEVKRSSTVRNRDLSGLRAFLEDYPGTRARLYYCGTKRFIESGIEVVPFEEGLLNLKDWLIGS